MHWWSTPPVIVIVFVVATLLVLAHAHDAHRMSLAIAVGESDSITLQFGPDDDLRAIANGFIAEHGLRTGEGCKVDDVDCVADYLVGAMRQISECPTSGCFNKVSIMEARQEKSLMSQVIAYDDDVYVEGSQSDAAGWAPVPCVPPFCKFRCAAGIADEDEVYPSLWEYPQPRECGPAGRLYPIVFGIPASAVVACVPAKSRDFAAIDPSSGSYLFGPSDEVHYHRNYRVARYGVTTEKRGWDCMRHYEILANGAAPFFVDLERSPSGTLAHLPKELLRALRDLPGVDRGQINHSLFNETLYLGMMSQLLWYTRNRLSTVEIARYVLETTGNAGATRVLYLSASVDPDYMRDTVLHGFRELLGPGLVDFVKPRHMYLPHDESQWEPQSLYGFGFSYAYRLDDIAVDRTRILPRIMAHEFDLVVFGSVHRGMPLLEDVQQFYPASEIVYIDGEDAHGWCDKAGTLSARGHYFMREMPDGCPPVD